MEEWRERCPLPAQTHIGRTEIPDDGRTQNGGQNVAVARLMGSWPAVSPVSPGVLCALCRPDLRITLSERIGKKAAFLLTLRRELGLSFEVFADDATRLPTGFGVVVSRAALPLPKWFPFAESLTAPRGYIYSMTSPSEPVPDAPPSLSLCLDMLYDVGEGQHRILAHRKAG